MSAGITAKPQLIHPQTRLSLTTLGITDVRHRQHKLNKKMLSDAHVVIGMAQNHLDFMKKKFGFTKTRLFNQVALGKNISILDIEDIVKDYRTNPVAVNKQIAKTIKQIHKNIPKFYVNLKKIDFD
jgi:protein-tyrosine-phosphatase